MQITTFGPLAVDGRPVRGARLATVIRTLVQARGRVVSTGALIDAVWDGTPPDDGAGAVQALVSRVRRLGLPVDAIAGGYRLPPDRVRVDAVEARALVDQARAAVRAGDVSAAGRCADRARALLPAVPEVTDPEASRLLADVAILRAEAALAGHGPYDETDLRQLVARTPPDEPAAALLVRVLAAQGRDAEALAVVEQLREELAERYGTSPSPVVAGAHIALLRGELGPPPSMPVEPPARTPRLSGLPVAWARPGTPLVGREADVAAVSAAVVDGPLVTVVATGGAGKTRLAGEVARRAAAGGRPVRIVELAGLRSSDEVLPALLAVLGGAETIAARPGTDRRPLSPDEQLRLVVQNLVAQDVLDGLVVLDNCEHVLHGAAAVVARLLAVTSPDVTVLATSRAPLGLAGEVVHRLGTLPDDDALALLAARARAGGAVLAWDSDRARQLCHRLDNLPLALELAAARLRHMPIDDVIAGLTDRFTLLDDALRGLPDRHASLWTMVDWSRELLAPEDRELLQRLAVVPAPFLAETAAAVADTPNVARGLAVLVEQSLLTLEDSDGGPPRYRMLETVREYGDVRLDAAGGRSAAMAGLVSWARTQATALACDFIGAGQLVALARCAADQDNLVAALRWSIAHDDEAAAVDVAWALFHLWTVRGLHIEVMSWGASLLHLDDPLARRRSAILAGRASGRPLPDADALAWTCLLVGVTGGVTGSLRLPAVARIALRRLFAERADEVSERPAALAGPLPVLDSLKPEASLRVAATMIANPDPYVQAFGFFVHAAVEDNAGQPQLSFAAAEQAYRRFEQAADHWGMGMAALSMGQWMGGGGRSAGEWLRRGEHHLELVGAVQDARSARTLLDAHLALQGDPDAAKRLSETSTSPQVEESDAAQAHLGLAQLAFQQERYDDALVHADAVTAIAASPAVLVPQQRIVFRVVATILYLRIAGAWPVSGAGDTRPGGDDDVDRRATELLTMAGTEAVSLVDMPCVGSWALGGAELAAYRGDEERTRELWALGVRLGANVLYLFQPGYAERLTAALGSEDDRASRLASWRHRPVGEAKSRATELMQGLLG